MNGGILGSGDDRKTQGEAGTHDTVRLFPLQQAFGVGGGFRVGSVSFLRPLGQGQPLLDFTGPEEECKKRVNTAGTAAAVLSLS